MNEPYDSFIIEPMVRVELASSAYKAEALPLSYKGVLPTGFEPVISSV